VKLNRQKNALVLCISLFQVEARSKEGKREARSKEDDEVGKNAYNMKRSVPGPLERGRYMSGLLPQAPLVRTLGAEDSSGIFIYT